MKRKDKALAETAALLVLQGKMQPLRAEEDDSTRPSSDALSSRTSRKRTKQGRVAISLGTLQRWYREVEGGEDRRHGPNTVPLNKLSEHEERRLLCVLNAPEHRNLPPRR